MSDTTIDTIFAEFGRKCSPIATLRNVDNPLVRREYIDQAKSALYELMLSVIGEDAEVPRPVDDESRDRFYRRSGQNFLRHQQRAKLKELFDGVR